LRRATARLDAHVPNLLAMPPAPAPTVEIMCENADGWHVARIEYFMPQIFKTRRHYEPTGLGLLAIVLSFVVMLYAKFNRPFWQA